MNLKSEQQFGFESSARAADSVAHRILLTGATGYIGGRLLSALQASGKSLRCLARHPENLRDRVAPQTEIVRGDVFDCASLVAALTGVDVAYYLIHSMGGGDDFEERDRRGARLFASAARECGVRRIIYLGGLGDSDQPLSAHLRSRQEVGDILRSSGVEVTEFRASIVIGSGSLSFEMIRALVERLPIMITPRWVSVSAQPIAVTDVVRYLTAALDMPAGGNRLFEIGGADRVSYGDLMREYAAQRGLRRLLIPVPFLTPWLSSLWLGLVTPLFAPVGRRLIESIRHPTVVRDRSALGEFSIQPLSYREAIAAALVGDDPTSTDTRCSDEHSSASSSSGRLPLDEVDRQAAHGPLSDGARIAIVAPICCGGVYFLARC